MQSYNCHLFHQPGRIWHGDGGGGGGSSSFPLHGPQLQDALSQCHHHECDRIKLSKDNSAAKEAVRTDHITGRGSRRRVKSSSLPGQPDIKRDGTTMTAPWSVWETILWHNPTNRLCVVNTGNDSWLVSGWHLMKYSLLFLRKEVCAREKETTTWPIKRPKWGVWQGFLHVLA